MTARVRDWQSRLQACQAERWARPFAWGSQDCALFAADCVQAITCIDPAADLRGTYADAAGAARVIRGHGGLRAIAAARLGAEISPLLAQAGDVGLCLNEGREVLAVFGGAMWLAPGLTGLQQADHSTMHVAWRCTKDSHG